MRTGAHPVPPDLSPLAEILFSLCLYSWVGLLLAESGVFSLDRVFLVQLLFSVILIVAAWGLGPRQGTSQHLRASVKEAFPGALRRQAATTLAGITSGLLVAVLYLPPFETIIMASDASFYFNTGVHIARTGSIRVPDPLLAELELEERALLFPPNETGGYARVPGGLLLPSLDSDVVWPTFSHILPVWVAAFYRLGGLEACGLVCPVFAALSVWAIFLFAAETLGRWAALLTGALVLTNFGEFWFGRFLMPEILAQFFLWGGLLNFVLWWRQGSLGAAALAALSFGIVGLTRVEYLFFVFLTVALVFGLAAQRPRGAWLFWVLYAGLLSHGLGQLLLVPTHYRDVLYSQMRALWGALLGHGWLATMAALFAAVALVVVVVQALTGSVSLRRRRAMALCAAGAYAAAFVHASEFKAVTASAWLASIVPWPVLGAAAIGLLLWTTFVRSDGSLALPLLLFGVVGAPLLYDPHVTPIQLWAVRRFVPVVMPFICLFAVTALAWGHRRFVPRRAAVLTAGVAAAVLALNAQPTAAIYRLGLFPDQKPAVRALADMMPPGAVVFFPPGFTDVLVPLPLWLVHDRESFVLPQGVAGKAFRSAVSALSGRHPIFYMDASFVPPAAVDGLEFHLRGRAQLRSLLPELHPIRAPIGGRPMLMPLRVYEVVTVSSR